MRLIELAAESLNMSPVVWMIRQLLYSTFRGNSASKWVLEQEKYIVWCYKTEVIVDSDKAHLWWYGSVVFWEEEDHFIKCTIYCKVKTYHRWLCVDNFWPWCWITAPAHQPSHEQAWILLIYFPPSNLLLMCIQGLCININDRYKTYVPINWGTFPTS